MSRKYEFYNCEGFSWNIPHESIRAVAGSGIQLVKKLENAI